MLNYIVLGVFCHLLSHSSASPLDSRAATSRTSVFQSIQKAGKPGPAELEFLYRKYNGMIPHDIKPPGDVVRAVRNDGTVKAEPVLYDVEYLSPVNIGGQTLNLVFDSGSSDLWVYSSFLPENESEGHSIYNPDKSPTARSLDGQTWAATYGDGSSANGEVFLDEVRVGNTLARSQAVEIAMNISLEFSMDAESDGILGLGFDSNNQVKPDKQKTFFSTVKTSLSSPLFTADLKKNKPGSYDFGFINPMKHTGTIEYIPVNAQLGFWGFNCSGYAIGGGAFTKRPMNAIMDTGTTLLLLPATMVSVYYAQVASALYNSTLGGYAFPCSNELPDLTLQLGGYQAVIPGSYMTYTSLNDGTGNCYGALQRNTNLPFSVFGDVFIKSQFVVFDSNGPKLGIAPKLL